MKKIDNLINFRENQPKLYEELVKYPCRVIAKGCLVYEGLYSKNIGYKLEDPSKAVVIFKINDLDYGVFTISENKNFDKFVEVFEGKKFEEVMKDPKLYNQMMNLSPNLPVFDPEWKINESKNDLYNKLNQWYKILNEEGEEESIPGDGLPDEKDEEKEKSLKRKAEIKFTIWKSPNEKTDWIENNTGYQKIEYVYTNSNKGLNIDFLLGFNKGSWNLYAGKLGAVSYDDDPIFDFHENDLAKAINLALDKIDEIIVDVEKNPENWPQFFINI